MVKSRTNQQIGYILRSYPRLSQTFVLNEILALEKAGVSIQIFALSHPQEAIVQPQVAEIKAPVHYLLPNQPLWQRIKEHGGIFLRAPFGYLKSLIYTLSRRVIDQGYTSSSRMTCFHQAVAFASLLYQDATSIDHLHAHFAHDPTFITQMVHWMTGIPYSFTAHARDLFQTPQAVLLDRIRDAGFVITCCTNNLKYLYELAPEECDKFSMIYHGVNLQMFYPTPDQRRKEDVPLILSAGRLVEKKGFFDLLQALQQVKEQGKVFRCEIYGEGPLLPDLTLWIEEHGLTGWVTLAGSLDQQQLIPIFQKAALFLLTPTVTEDGDRDGIPNVLVEAMAVGLPVISTSVAGIPELITHELDGLLFSPHDVHGITSGVIDLLQNTEKCDRLSRAARRKVLELFDITRAAGRLKDLYAQPYQVEEVPSYV